MSRQCLSDLRETFSRLASVRAQASPRACKFPTDAPSAVFAHLVTENSDERLCHLAELVWLMWQCNEATIEVLWHGNAFMKIVGFRGQGLAVAREGNGAVDLVKARALLREFAARGLPELFMNARLGWREWTTREGVAVAGRNKSVTGAVSEQILRRCQRSHKLYVKKAQPGMKFDVFWAVYLARVGFPIRKAAFGRLSDALYFIAVRREQVNNFFSCTSLLLLGGAAQK